ncbi:MAG: hypothetical protein ACYC7G_09525 [Rudaea sp.]
MRYVFWIARAVAVAGMLAACPAFAGIPTTSIFGGSIVDFTSPGLGVGGPTQTITLNFGGPANGALLTSLALAGANAGDFAIVGGTCQPNTTVLQPSPGPTSCTVIVQYKASSANPESAQLNGTCQTVALAVGGFSLACTGASGELASLAGTLLAALVSTPMLDPKTLTALCALLLAIGVYYANRKRA